MDHGHVFGSKHGVVAVVRLRELLTKSFRSLHTLSRSRSTLVIDGKIRDVL